MEGKRLTSLLSDNILYPAIIFCFNKKDNSTFNRGSIIDRLEGNVSVDIFRDSLIRNIELKDNMIKTNTNSTVSIMNEQKEEMEYLERLEEDKKRQLREDKLKIEKEIAEKKKKELEIIKLKEEKQKSLPAEPEATNTESTLIIFRYPDGDRRKERRFLKSHTIKNLYDFVDTLGSDIYMESDKYELIQPFPFKLYGDFDKTLENEKLYPNAILQIREI